MRRKNLYLYTGNAGFAPSEPLEGGSKQPCYDVIEAEAFLVQFLPGVGGQIPCLAGPGPKARTGTSITLPLPQSPNPGQKKDRVAAVLLCNAD